MTNSGLADSDKQTKIELCASGTQRYMKYITGVFRISERRQSPPIFSFLSPLLPFSPLRSRPSYCD